MTEISSIDWVVWGLAIYILISHAVGFLAIRHVRARVARLEQVARTMGVQFGEDTDGER